MTETRAKLTQEANQRLEALMSLRRQALCREPLPRAISLPQLSILLTLQERGPLTVSDLAHLLSVSTPSASAIADRLVDHGLIERERDETDRRYVFLRVSQQGRTAVEEIVGIRHYQTQRLMNAMTDGELADLIRGMKALEAAVQRLRPDVQPAPEGQTHQEGERLQPAR